MFADCKDRFAKFAKFAAHSGNIMTNVSIIGIGQTAVKEHWSTSIRHLAWYAIEAALDDAHISKVDALYVGNMFSRQSLLQGV